MQLAQPPLTNQSTVPTSAAGPYDSITDYSFPIKLGDKDNVFDGLVGVFRPKEVGGGFDFSKFQCYHDPSPNNQPQLQYIQPFYIDPRTAQNDYIDYIDAVESKFSRLAAIVDPFTPIHVYSALLPIQQLTIPPWCISQGLSRIASFFKTGPTLVAEDVPAFNPVAIVDKDYRLDDAHAPGTTGKIAIPCVGMADFKWLQPYWVDAAKKKEVSGENDGSTQYNVMEIETPSVQPLWQTPPYVVTEGYLQMAKPFTATNTVAQKQQGS